MEGFSGSSFYSGKSICLYCQSLELLNGCENLTVKIAELHDMT
jgi:hypothetical protein